MAVENTPSGRGPAWGRLSVAFHRPTTRSLFRRDGAVIFPQTRTVVHTTPHDIHSMKGGYPQIGPPNAL
jgi:hypothetical protein